MLISGQSSRFEPRPVFAAFSLACAIGLSLLALSCSSDRQSSRQRGGESVPESATPSPADKPAQTKERPVIVYPAGKYSVIDGKIMPFPSMEMGDRRVVDRIITEGRDRSQVMAHLRHLSETIGPRLTGSTRAEEANRWTAAQFSSWGLSNVRLEPWGTIPVRFDRNESWARVIEREKKRTSRRGDRPAEATNEPDVSVDEPPTWKTVRDMQFSTLAWTTGTPDGDEIRGHVVRLPEDRAEYERVKDSLDGAWVLVPPPPSGTRGVRGAGQMAGERYRARRDARAKIAAGTFNVAEAPLEDVVLTHKVAGFVTSSRDERVWTTSAPGWRELDPANIPTDIEVMVRLSDYDFLNSRLRDGEDVHLGIKLDHRLTPGPHQVFNTIAEIPGRTKPEEVVIMSAHLDSWDGPGSQGTTDNGTGSAVMLEAARLLMAAGARPDRTIRFILWTGEEQGLLGSRAYVQQNSAELPRISAAFVDDGGTNFQGGLTCTREMADLLAAATAPVNGVFADDKTGEALYVNITPKDEFKPGGGSDHYSFFEAGVPGFFWDEVGRAEYGYGWHTQNDRIDLAIPRYLEQSAVCSAVTAYRLACAPTLLPRWRSDTGPRLEAPDWVRASDGAYADYVLVQWDEVPGARSYDVYRCRSEASATGVGAEDAGQSDCEKIATGTDRTTFEDRAVPAGERWWYVVEARAKDGDGRARSAKGEPGFRGSPPAVRSVRIDSSGSGRSKITWDTPEGVVTLEALVWSLPGEPERDAKGVVELDVDDNSWEAPTSDAATGVFIRARNKFGVGPWTRADVVTDDAAK